MRPRSLVLATALTCLCGIAALAPEPALARSLVRITSAPPHRTVDATATFRWTTSHQAAYASCRLQRTSSPSGSATRVMRAAEALLADPPLGRFVRCSSPETWRGLEPGRYRFTLRVYAGGGGRASARYRWTVVASAPAQPAPDVSPPATPTPASPPTPPPVAAPSPAPTVTLTSSPTALTTDTAATLAWTTTGAVSSASCSLDGGVAVACSSPVSYAGLTTGTHLFSVTVSDGSRTASATASWTVTGTGSPPAPGRTYTYLNPVHPEISTEEQAFVDLVNQARAQAGTAPLRIDARLSTAADSHSYWQDATYGGNGLSHTGNKGSGPGERATDAGYSWSAVGEVTLVYPGASAATAFQMFMNSAPHRAILLDPIYTDIGVGESAYHWTGLTARP